MQPRGYAGGWSAAARRRLGVVSQLVVGGSFWLNVDQAQWYVWTGIQWKVGNYWTSYDQRETQPYWQTGDGETNTC